MRNATNRAPSNRSKRRIFIVTGSTLRAESMDRPLAYYLRETILNHPAFFDCEVHVLSDFRYMHERSYSDSATISLGGPGLNALTHKWLDELPVLLGVEDEFALQWSEDWDRPRVSIWGLTSESTSQALATFVDHHLEDFLFLCTEGVESH